LASNKTHFNFKISRNPAEKDEPKLGDEAEVGWALQIQSDFQIH